MAAFICACVAPPTSTATNVPSAGRARRLLFEAIGNRHDPLHTLSHVMRRQCGAGDVADIVPDLERTAAALADELREPARAPDFAAVGFAVLEDVNLAYPPRRIQGDRIVDVEVLSDHPVKDEKPDGSASGFGSPDAVRLHDDKIRRSRKSAPLRFRY